MSDQQENYSDILKSSTEKMMELAQNDPSTIIVKSSIEVPTVETPKTAPVPNLPKDVVIVSSEPKVKGDQDAPHYLIAEDPLARNFDVVDYETDQLIQDIFYANRETGTVLEYSLTDRKGNVFLQVKKQKVYFNRK